MAGPDALRAGRAVGSASRRTAGLGGDREPGGAGALEGGDQDNHRNPICVAIVPHVPPLTAHRDDRAHVEIWACDRRSGHVILTLDDFR